MDKARLPQAKPGGVPDRDQEEVAAMIETNFEVTTAEGVLPVYLTHPERGRHPLVIIYMDAYGVRQELRDMAVRLATSGFAVALPNLYYRVTTDELLPIPEPDEFDRLDLLTRCVQSVTIPGVMADTGSLFERLAAIEAVDLDRVGCVGYCMSGRFAVAAAARFQDRVRSAASFYGTWLVSEDPESPHISAMKTDARIYFGCAEEDHWLPLDVVERLRSEVAPAGDRVDVEVYEGTHHAFAFPTRRQYHREGEALHWERLLSLFNETLR